MKPLLVAMAITLTGCHLIFPFESVSPDSTVDGGADSDMTDSGFTDATTDGWSSDQYTVKPDGLQPDSIMSDTKPDSLVPDSLVSDSLQPDSSNPCLPLNPCKNGGTCSIVGGKAVCTCVGNWDPATKCVTCKTGYAGTSCNQCDTDYCNYPSCELKPVVTSASIDCSLSAGSKCHLNQNVYPVSVNHQNSPDHIKLTVLWYSGCNLKITDMGTFSPNDTAVTANPFMTYYTTPVTTYVASNPGYAQVEIELSKTGKPSCTTTDITKLTIKVE